MVSLLSLLTYSFVVTHLLLFNHIGVFLFNYRENNNYSLHLLLCAGTSRFHNVCTGRGFNHRPDSYWCHCWIIQCNNQQINKKFIRTAQTNAEYKYISIDRSPTFCEYAATGLECGG